jgi:hypothetical protein
MCLDATGQKLYDELKDCNFIVITVAMESLGGPPTDPARQGVLPVPDRHGSSRRRPLQHGQRPPGRVGR